MSNGVSLLPQEYKDKENAEKIKAKGTRPLPSFKLHQPEEMEKTAVEDNIEKELGDEITFGVEIPAEKPAAAPPKPIIEQKPVQPIAPPKPLIEHKPVQPIIPPRPPIERKPIPLKPAVEVKPPQPVERKPIAPKPIMEKKPVQPKEKIPFRLHIPEIQKEERLQGTRVIKENSDKFEEIEKPPTVMEYLRKKPIVPVGEAGAEVNLISANFEQTLNKNFWEKLKSLLTIVLILVILFAAGFVGIKIYKMQLLDQESALKQSVKELENELVSFNDEQSQAERLRKRAMALEELLNSHVYWTKIFDALEHNTAENVLYTNFVAEDSGRILLSAVGNKYSDAAEQLYLFENADFAQSVEINSVTMMQPETAETPISQEAPETQVQFAISLMLKDKSLIK
ncbi:hypothetical protein KKC32_04965 [Patescibacteria group bacterium]|nr:hypothetical protein [Patescibacteria group bacterium]